MSAFPDSFLAETEAQNYEWRAAFIQTYLERDVPSLGPRIPAETLHRFWQMLAHNQGQMLNAAQLAAGLGISGQTVARYLDIMVDLLLVRRLQPWATDSSMALLVGNTRALTCRPPAPRKRRDEIIPASEVSRGR